MRQDACRLPGQKMKTEPSFSNSRILTTVLYSSRLIEYSDTGKNFFDTYYVYDDLGHLTAVLPPKLSDTIKAGYLDNEQISNYAFLYVYGVGGLFNSKKLPDADWVYYLYDRSGRAVFSQDGNQRNRNEWSFHLTDRSGRECITGT